MLIKDNVIHIYGAFSIAFINSLDNVATLYRSSYAAIFRACERSGPTSSSLSLVNPFCRIILIYST